MKKELKNTVHSAVISGISEQGIGIATINNKCIYIPNTLPDETVQFKIIKENRTFAIGKCLSIEKQSIHRVKESCSIATSCGGCQLQHLSYPKQLEYKESLLAPLTPSQTHKCPSLLETRNKAQFAVTRTHESIQIGLYATHSHRVIDTESCAIQSPLINALFKDVRNFILNYNPSIYNELTQEGSLRHIVIRSSDYEKKVMLAFVCNTRDLTFENACLMEFQNHPLIGSLLLNINTDPGDTVLGSKTNVLYGKEEMIECIAGNLFHFNLHTFIQSNRTLTETLYKQIKLLGSFRKTQHVVDLYCGIGTITQFIAPYVHSIIGVEENKDSIRLARTSLSLSKLENCSFIEGKVEHSLAQLEETPIDIIILDPPRKGCHLDVLSFIQRKKIKKVIYVSCNPSSLKRDLAQLDTHYTTKTIETVDMFPHTIHLETITILQLRKKTPK